MEDFGYKKTGGNIKLSKVVKKSLMLAATIFSLCLFLYITITAYHYVYSVDEKNIKIIKSPSNSLKVFAKHKEINDSFDQAIYRDILENKNVDDLEKSKIVKSPEPIKPKPQEDIIEINSQEDVKEIIEVSKLIKDESLPKDDDKKIIVFNEKKSDSINKVLDDGGTGRKRSEEKSTLASKKNKRVIRVQVAALTSMKSAEMSWDKLKRLYPNLFYDRNYIIQKVDLGSRGIFYRLQIGDFYNQIKAEEFCKEYITKANKSNADCIMVE